MNQETNTEKKEKNTVVVPVIATCAVITTASLYYTYRVIDSTSKIVKGALDIGEKVIID